MAKAKKAEKALTAEEKLERALVPEEEWPYKTPDNWLWILLGNAVFIRRGASPRPIKQYVTEEENGVNWIKIGDTDTGKYITSVKEKITQKGADNSVFVEKGTLLLSNSMSFGRPYILNVDGCIHDGWLAITPSDCFNKEYLYYALLASKWYFEQAAVGTAVRNLNSNRVAATPISVPPLAEQQRIVDRIERIFTKLDEAREKAQAVVDGFELRRSAILHKAFTGELTKQWRREHGVGLDSWTTKPLKDVACLQTGVMKGKNYSERTVPFPYLRVANVQDGYLDLDVIKEIEIPEVLVQRYMLRQGDVLFTEGGDFDKLGRGTVWEGQIDNCLHQNHVFVVRPDGNVLNPYFLSLQAGSRYGKKYFLSCSKQTTNLASINSTQLKHFPVMIPCMEEQVKIVQLVGRFLTKERQVQASAESVLARIDAMKKAVLARAFRGKLGTGDPTEESAAESLKAVL